MLNLLHKTKRRNNYNIRQQNYNYLNFIKLTKNNFHSSIKRKSLPLKTNKYEEKFEVNKSRAQIFN